MRVFCLRVGYDGALWLGVFTSLCEIRLPVYVPYARTLQPTSSVHINDVQKNHNNSSTALSQSWGLFLLKK